MTVYLVWVEVVCFFYEELNPNVAKEDSSSEEEARYHPDVQHGDWRGLWQGAPEGHHDSHQHKS